jgi:hypothetical protein
MDEDIVQFFGVMMVLLSTGLIGYAGFTLIGALKRRLDRVESPGLNPDELEALRLQAEEGEQLRVRLGEIEERLDFAERLLARQQEAPRIGEGDR